MSIDRESSSNSSSGEEFDEKGETLQSLGYPTEEDGLYTSTASITGLKIAYQQQNNHPSDTANESMKQAKKKKHSSSFMKEEGTKHAPLLSTDNEVFPLTGERRRTIRVKCVMCDSLAWKPTSSQLVALSLLLQLFNFVICSAMPKKAHFKRNDAGLLGFTMFAHLCLWIAQFCISVQIIVTVKRKLWKLAIRHICEMYIGTLITFAGFYCTVWFYWSIIPSKAFYFPNQPRQCDTDDDNDDDCGGERPILKAGHDFEIVIALIYFSVSTQTLCGVANLIPLSYLVQLMSAVQMLIGVVYAVFIISFTLTRLGRDIERRMERDMHENHNHNHNDHFGSVNDDDQYYISDNGGSVAMAVTSGDNDLSEKSKLKQVRDQPMLRKFRRFTRRFLLLTVVLIQTMKGVLLWYIDDESLGSSNSNHQSPSWLIFLAVLIDIMSILPVISTSMKYVHIGYITSITVYNLLQCYLSCVIIFVGCYSDLQLFGRGHNKAFVLGESNLNDHGNFQDDSFVPMLYHFSYFSFAVMTLNGNGLNIEPHRWYAVLFVIFEMLLGVFFHVVVFGLGLLKVANARLKAETRNSDLLTNFNHLRKRSESLSYSASYGGTKNNDTHQRGATFIGHRPSIDDANDEYYHQHSHTRDSSANAFVLSTLVRGTSPQLKSGGFHDF